ncbi:MAG: phosphatase PAP2 family protein [Leptolyngbyaceae cyanobacterium]
MNRWRILQLIRVGWHRFWKESHQIPYPVWRRWFGTLILGLGLCALLTLALTVSVKGHLNQGIQSWDEAQLPILAERLPLTFSRAITWESPGNLLGMLPIIGLFTAITVARSQPLLTATMLVGYVLQFSLVWIGWGYWNRDRPNLIADGVAASGLHSFPSGHTVVVITVYGILGYLWCSSTRSWAERLLAIVLTGFWLGMIISSRLVLGAHWPTDVIVGVAIGVSWLSVIIVALHRVRDVWQKF